MVERIDRDELRALIREALKEALGGTDSFPPPLRGRAREGVAPRSEDSPVPAQEQASRHPSPTPPRKGEGQAARFTSGVLNESKVAELGRTHSKIIIEADVAVTPLARDRAREIKVEIVRQKP
jgi:hypothetical protein